jgi:polygalacturonase
MHQFKPSLVSCLSLQAALWLLAASSLTAASFNVVDYGALADDPALDSPAIQKAIDAAAQLGGGKVVFAKGTYLTGALFLKSNVELHLGEGVVLRAVPDDAAYPEIWSRVAGIEMNWPAAVLNVYGQTNVTISGKGTLDGSGDFWWKKFWGADGKGGMLKDYQSRGLRWAADYDCKRVRALLIYNSKNVNVTGITIERSGFWSLTATYSEKVTIDGVIIRANIGGHGPSSDGIDIDSSRDVLVENCDIDANDDNICLKAGRDADGLRVNRPTENITIRNCVTRAGYGMVTFGSETSGGIRNVEVSGMKAIGTKFGVHFKSAKIRGGVVENISVHDVTMENVDRPIAFELNWYPSYSVPVIPAELAQEKHPAVWDVLLQPVTPPARGIPEVRNVSFANLKAAGAKFAVMAEGFSEKPIHDIRFTNVVIKAESAGKIKYASNWECKNMVVQATDGKPLVQTDCVAVEIPLVSRQKPLQAAALQAETAMP